MVLSIVINCHFDPTRYVQVSYDHRSYERNFKLLRIEGWKSQDFNGVWTCDLAIPVRRSNQLSYEATDVGNWSFVSSNEPVKSELWRPVEVLTFSGFYTQLLKIAFITAMITAYLISNPQFSMWNIFIYHYTSTLHGFIRTHKWPAPNVSGFIAQLVRASHRYREVTGSNPVEVLTFSGFYAQLLKIAFITAMIIAYLISNPQFNIWNIFIYHFRYVQVNSLECLFPRVSAGFNILDAKATGFFMFLSSCKRTAPRP